MSDDMSSLPAGRHCLVRALFVLAGSLFLATGLIGVVLPMLPTTPFLILAAFCFARGSHRCYEWLVRNRLFGRYLEDYLRGRGVPWSVKAVALAFLWLLIGLTTLLFADRLWLRILLAVIALAVTTHIVLIKGRNPSNPT
jgi:uncharacterized protein